MRRKDFLEVLGQVPVPQPAAGMHLVDVLFKVGPVKADSAITEADLEPWERRRGMELAPWQAELLVDLSQAYMREMHEAKHWAALAPWPPARNMWKYVRDQLSNIQQVLDEPIKEKPGHGHRQRHRNPPAS